MIQNAVTPSTPSNPVRDEGDGFVPNPVRIPTPSTRGGGRDGVGASGADFSLHGCTLGRGSPMTAATCAFERCQAGGVILPGAERVVRWSPDWPQREYHPGCWAAVQHEVVTQSTVSADRDRQPFTTSATPGSTLDQSHEERR